MKYKVPKLAEFYSTMPSVYLSIFCLSTLLDHFHIHSTTWEQGFFWMMISLGFVLPDSNASRVMYYINSDWYFTIYLFLFHKNYGKKKNLHAEKKRVLFSSISHNLDGSWAFKTKHSSQNRSAYLVKWMRS